MKLLAIVITIILVTCATLTVNAQTYIINEAEGVPLLATIHENLRDDGTKSPYTSLEIEMNEKVPAYVYGSQVGFFIDGEQLDFQPEGKGTRTILLCCTVGIPTVWLWTVDKSGNVLSVWTNGVMYQQYLPIVER